MSDYFMGQIVMSGFGYAPRYFAQCNGQILSITQNQGLFSLLGSVYGGDGRATFALPDLRSRTPVGGFPSRSGGWQPPAYVLGQIGGQESVALQATQLPVHGHGTTMTSSPGTARPPRTAGLTLGAASPDTFSLYGPANQVVPLAASPLVPAGASQPHPNIQPYETINFNVALYGIYPSRN